jgi:hypothetical protein
MQLLKQSVSSVVTIGPVLDSDGLFVSTMVIGDVSISKNGTTSTLSTETLTHIANGMYSLTLSATNTNTLGRLDVFVNNTAMAMTNHRYDVLVAATYDAVVTNGVATAAEAAAIQADTNDIQTRLPAALVSGRMDASVGAMASNVITAASMATDASGEIADAVWDEVLTGATHNVAASAGRRLRQLASVIVHSGTAQGAGTGNNQIQLDTGASAINGAYDPGLVYIETGTGAGQTRLILQYNGSTKVATVDRDWRVNPDNTSEFVILGDAGRESVNEGLAQAATTTTITLNTSASTSDDAYNGQLVFIRSGTGQDQIALVEDYVGSTKVATIRTRSANGEWAIVPDTTSAYVMIPNLTWTIAEMQAGLATSSGVTSAFTEIKGAGWSSATDTLEKISDAAGTGGATVIVSPLSAQAPERVVGTTIDIAVGDRSPVSVDVFDANDAAVDLSAQGNLEVCIESRNNTDLQVVAHASITIGGTGNRRATWTPNAAAVATVDKHRWSLRTESAKKVLAYGPWVVSRVALKDA